tara:strand:+ start:312 stop:863 length:552 start_codon:yes stop_codon:yes gene_type:complete
MQNLINSPIFIISKISLLVLSVISAMFVFFIWLGWEPLIWLGGITSLDVILVLGYAILLLIIISVILFAVWNLIKNPSGIKVVIRNLVLIIVLFVVCLLISILFDGILPYDGTTGMRAGNSFVNFLFFEFNMLEIFNTQGVVVDRISTLSFKMIGVGLYMLYFLLIIAIGSMFFFNIKDRLTK